MHGGGSNAAQQQKYSKMDPLADREHFIVVYPDGTGRIGMHVWNAGTCCGAAPAPSAVVAVLVTTLRPAALT